MSQPRAVTQEPSRRDYWIGTAAALATVAMWASWPVVTRYGVTGTLTPEAIGVVRFMLPAIVLAPVWWRIGLIPKGMSWKLMLGLFCGGLPFFYGAAAAFRYAPVATSGSVLSGSITLIVAVIAFAMFRVQVEAIRLFGYALIALSVVISLVHGYLMGTEGILIGDALFLLTAMAWALYTLAYPFSKLSGLQASALISVWGFIVILPFGAADVIAAVRAEAYFALGLQLFQQGLLSAILSIVTFSIAVTRIGPARAATLVALTPLIAAAGAYFALGEKPDMVVTFALVLTTAGVLIASKPPKSVTR